VVIAVASHPSYQKLHWRQVATALGPTRAPRAILLDAPSVFGLSLALYVHHTWWLPRTGADVSEIDLLRKLPSHPQCNWVWWGAACHYDGYPPLRRPPAKGFRLVSSERVAGFEIARYRSPRPVRLYPRRRFAAAAPRARFVASRYLMLSPRHTPLFP